MPFIRVFPCYESSSINVDHPLYFRFSSLRSISVLRVPMNRDREIVAHGISIN